MGIFIKNVKKKNKLRNELVYFLAILKKIKDWHSTKNVCGVGLSIAKRFETRILDVGID